MKNGVAAAVVARRLFVLLPFAMIFGLAAYAVLPFEPLPVALIVVALGLGAAVAMAWRFRALPVVALLCAFWAGFCLLPIHSGLSGTPMLAFPAYGTFEARVDVIISANAEERRIVVSGLTPLGNTRAVAIRRARLLVPAEPVLELGDIISGRFRLAPVPGPVLPDGYDGQFHSYFSGIGAYGSVIGDFAVVMPASGFDLSRMVESLRFSIGARIDAVLEGDTAAIGRAMVMGDQSALSDETRDILAESGLAHIYSISGLHLSIVAGGVFWLLRLGLAAMPALATRLPVKKLAAIGGLVAAFGYLMLAGGPANVPALRSTIMLALIFGAVLAGRRALTMRNVAFAALAIILVDPASVFRPSFQLSFAAVVGLIGYFELPRRPVKGRSGWLLRMGSTVWVTAMTSFIAGLATLLFSAYHFQQTAPLGVVGNVLVLPVVSLVIMPFAVISVLLMPLGIEGFAVSVMGWGIDRMVDVGVLVAGWSEGLTGNPLLTPAAMLIGLAALAWFAFIGNWWRMAGPIVALPLILLLGLDQRPDILVADTTQAIALRGAEGVGLVTGRIGSFAVEVWSQHYQEAIGQGLAEARCDSIGCVATTPKFSIAVIKSAAAFAEDCPLHDLVISRIRVPATCAVAQHIDAAALRTGGVHWLRWDETAERFDIRTAVPNITRPWRVLPR